MSETRGQEQLRIRLTATAPFTAILPDRLRELQANIRQSQGWNAGETPQERDAIVREWNRMPGFYSFSSAVNQLISEVESAAVRA